MELRVLRYFLAVAREENITKAAALLHVTQPTLSRQLMQLEEELGVKLFHRSQYRVILTDDGMLLRRRAQEIVELADKAEKELQHTQAELVGEVAIGCGESVGMTFLSKHICNFRKLHPQVQFRIYSANADDIKEHIEKRLAGHGAFDRAGGHRTVFVFKNTAERPLGRSSAERSSTGNKRGCHIQRFAGCSSACQWQGNRSE